MTTIFKGIMT